MQIRNFSNSVTEFFGRASYHLFISHWVLVSILIKTAGLSVLSLPRGIAAAFALGALAPLHAKAQAQGSGDFSSMWAGQAASLGRDLPARELTTKLADEAQALMQRMAV